MSLNHSTKHEAVRLETAADWLQRLHTAQRDETLLAHWLDWCKEEPANLDAFERMHSVWQAFDSLDVDAGPRADASADRTMSTAPVAGSARPWASFGIGLLVLLGVVAGWSIQSRQDIAARILVTGVAEHDSQHLSDGSRVELGGRTRIVARYSAVRRSVAIEAGEAFFEVAKDTRRPFVVTSGALSVTALGTAFNVRRTLDRTVVMVTEGLVNVAATSRTASASSHPGYTVRVRPGERLAFSDITHRLNITRADPKTATAWREGVLRFIDEPLAAVIHDVNRYAFLPIRIENSRLGQRLYTGTVYPDRINDWLRALERVFPLKAIRGDGGITLAPRSPGSSAAVSDIS